MGNNGELAKGFYTLSKILTGEEYYGRAESIVVFLDRHPLDPNCQQEWIEFYGPDGITASIGGFLKRVSTEDSENITEIIFYEQQPGSVYAEVRFENFTYIVGGMTNNSGEGGKGRQMTYASLHLIASLHGISVKTVPITEAQYEHAYAMIREQMEGMYADDH